MSFDLNLSWGDISSKTNYKEKGEKKNNGEIYSGESSSSWIMLEEDSYEINFT